MGNLQEGYDPNLNYQFYAGAAGGSDTQRKLTAIDLPKLQGKRFLDLGCNAGFFCVHALNEGASRVVGVDSSPKVIALARARHPTVEFFDTGWDKFPDGEFDVVINLSAIHYAANQIRLIDTVWEHLSVGGLFILEGGMLGEDTLSATDLPVVCWREVGDRVRHLSLRFLQRHALTRFQWRVLGPSIMQGGDPIPRFAIHARKSDGDRPRAQAQAFTLCPVEYAAALALSGPTIQPAQASYAYVRALAAALQGADPTIAAGAVLAEAAALGAFADDVVYAMRGYGKDLRLIDSLGPELTEKLSAALSARGLNVLAAGAAPAAPDAAERAVMNRMEAGVEFTEDEDEDEGGALAKMLSHCALEGARVAAFCGGGMVTRLLAAGVAECHVLAGAGFGGDPRIVEHSALPWNVNASGLKYVFLDSSAYDAFDHVDDAIRMAAALPAMLARDGLAYAMLRTGVVQTDWDVYNSVLLSPIGRLPSSDYLFNGIFRDFAVRPLLRIAEPKVRTFCASRVFRLAPRLPSLLLVAAASQGGKTTLSRSLRRAPGAFHLSNDYIFFEIFRFRGLDALPGCSPGLLAAIGGGTAEDVGNFFRALEADDALFLDYLSLVRSLIPRGEMNVSLDLDLRTPERLEQAKEYFTQAGFSVWAVTR